MKPRLVLIDHFENFMESADHIEGVDLLKFALGQNEKPETSLL